MRCGSAYASGTVVSAAAKGTRLKRGEYLNLEQEVLVVGDSSPI